MHQQDALSNSDGCITAGVIPKCEAGACATRNIMGLARWTCLRCRTNYEPVVDASGQDNIIQCVCPRGTFESSASADSCTRCPANSFCPGGDKVENPTSRGTQVTCGDNLITRTNGSRSAVDCVAPSGYALTAPGTATACNPSEYAPQFNRLAKCLRCQSGLAEPPSSGLTFNQRASKRAVCKIPPGRYVSQGLVRICPQGFYRENWVEFDAAVGTICLPCNVGITTDGAGAGLASYCNKTLPGYGISPVLNVTGPASIPALPPTTTTGLPNATLCDIGFYSLGGYCAQCPNGTVTTVRGAKSVEECVVPPGYYLTPAGAMPQCGNSTFREGWVMYSDPRGRQCTPCGDGIASEPRDLDVHPLAQNGSLVRATSASCFIESGMGMIAQGKNLFVGMDCPINTYGAAGKVYGWAAAPCKPCPRNMITDNKTRVNNSDVCINDDGFGYASEGASRCAPGFYSAKGSRRPCQQCPSGRTTANNATQQRLFTDCYVKPGFGLVASNGNASDSAGYVNSTANLADEQAAVMPVLPCPLGYYGSGGSLRATCTKCPDGSTTADVGAENATQCALCLPGWGIQQAPPSTTCTPCNYGSYHPGGSTVCTSCPTTTFFAPVDGRGANWTSVGLTLFLGAVGEEFCVPRDSQLSPDAGQAYFNAALLPQLTKAPAATLGDCVRACAPDSACLTQWDARPPGTCYYVALALDGAGTTGLFLRYKLPPSTLGSASSVQPNRSSNKSSTLTGSSGQKKIVRAKQMSSGIYARAAIPAASAAFWAAAGVPLSASSAQKFVNGSGVWDGPGRTEAACQQKCDNSVLCWGFVWSADNSSCLYKGGEDALSTRSFFVLPAVPSGAGGSGGSSSSGGGSGSSGNTSSGGGSTGGGGSGLNLEEAAKLIFPQGSFDGPGSAEECARNCPRASCCVLQFAKQSCRVTALEDSSNPGNSYARGLYVLYKDAGLTPLFKDGFDGGLPVGRCMVPDLQAPAWGANNGDRLDAEGDPSLNTLLDAGKAPEGWTSKYDATTAYKMCRESKACWGVVVDPLKSRVAFLARSTDTAWESYLYSDPSGNGPGNDDGKAVFPDGTLESVGKPEECQAKCPASSTCLLQYSASASQCRVAGLWDASFAYNLGYYVQFKPGKAGDLSSNQVSASPFPASGASFIAPLPDKMAIAWTRAPKLDPADRQRPLAPTASPWLETDAATAWEMCAASTECWGLLANKAAGTFAFMAPIPTASSGDATTYLVPGGSSGSGGGGLSLDAAAKLIFPQGSFDGPGSAEECARNCPRASCCVLQFAKQSCRVTALEDSSNPGNSYARGLYVLYKDAGLTPLFKDGFDGGLPMGRCMVPDLQAPAWGANNGDRLDAEGDPSLNTLLDAGKAPEGWTSKYDATTAYKMCRESKACWGVVVDPLKSRVAFLARSTDTAWESYLYSDPSGNGPGNDDGKAVFPDGTLESVGKPEECQAKCPASSTCLLQYSASASQCRVAGLWDASFAYNLGYYVQFKPGKAGDLSSNQVSASPFPASGASFIAPLPDKMAIAWTRAPKLDPADRQRPLAPTASPWLKTDTATAWEMCAASTECWGLLANKAAGTFAFMAPIPTASSGDATTYLVPGGSSGSGSSATLAVPGPARASMVDPADAPAVFPDAAKLLGAKLTLTECVQQCAYTRGSTTNVLDCCLIQFSPSTGACRVSKLMDFSQGLKYDLGLYVIYRSVDASGNTANPISAPPYTKPSIYKKCMLPDSQAVAWRIGNTLEPKLDAVRDPAKPVWDTANVAGNITASDAGGLLNYCAGSPNCWGLLFDTKQPRYSFRTGASDPVWETYLT